MSDINICGRFTTPPTNALTHVDQESIKNYVPHDGEWLDGKRADIVFAPARNVSSTLPPVPVEIQNVVDKPFLRSLNVYCNHICEKYKTEPIAITICIRSVRGEISEKFINSFVAPYCKTLPCGLRAKKHLIMTPRIMKDYLEKYGYESSNSNDADDPLPPLAALAYVLMEQKCSMIGLRRASGDISLSYVECIAFGPFQAHHKL